MSATCNEKECLGNILYHLDQGCILPEFDYYANYYPCLFSNLADDIVTTTANTNDYEDTTTIHGTELIQTTTKGKSSVIRC